MKKIAKMPHYTISFICDLCQENKPTHTKIHLPYTTVCESCFKQIKRQDKLDKILPDEN